MQAEPVPTVDALAGHPRLVVKIGSALLVDGRTGQLRAQWLAALAADIAMLKAEGRDVVIVSSGAIALGRRLLGLPGKTLPLDQSQAAAAAGQIALSQAWSSHLAEHGITTGQILLTPNITEERRYFLNARTTVNTLLNLGAVPIINENDSVATFEIRYGDNDRLSARVATMIEAAPTTEPVERSNSPEIISNPTGSAMIPSSAAVLSQPAVPGIEKNPEPPPTPTKKP